MAKRKVWVGSQGPFIYDDSEPYPNEPGTTQVGLRAETIIEVANVATTNLTTNVRLVVSNADKQVQEVNDLTNWITGGSNVDVSDDGSGGVTVEFSADSPVPLPSYTTTERNNLTPSAPVVIWNNTEGRIEYYDGANWNYLSGTAV